MWLCTDNLGSLGAILFIDLCLHISLCMWIQRAAPITKKSGDKTHTKRVKHTACSFGVAKPSSREAAPAARAEPDNQQRFQQMLRFVNKLFAGDHEKLTLNTIRIMVEKSFSAKEIQSLLPRVLYTLDSSNRVMVVVHRLWHLSQRTSECTNCSSAGEWGLILQYSSMYSYKFSQSLDFRAV